MALGDRLKEARRLRKLSQVALAKYANVSQGLISDLENNVYPTSAAVPKFADILKVSAIWLSEGKGDKFAEPENVNSKAITVAGIKINTMEENLLAQYSKLSGKSQNAIDLMVNHLYSLEYPDDLKANPTNGKKKKEFL